MSFSRFLKMRPGARFVQRGTVSAGQLEQETAEQSFELVSLYEHRISLNVRPIQGVVYVCNNGFLASHAYNIALAWIYYTQIQPERSSLEAVLRHNFKKFFAECALQEANCLMGRALLIETLAFEQELMRRLFEWVETDVAAKKAAQGISSLMSDLATRHELIHIFAERDRSRTEEEVGKAFGGRVAKTYAQVSASYGEHAAEEVLCDLGAASLVLNEANTAYASYASYDAATRLRMIAFASQVFSHLIALELCAHQTARSASAEDDRIQLGSEVRLKEPFSFSHKREALADLRSATVLEVIADQLKEMGQTLDCADGQFPLLPDTGSILKEAFETFMDVAPDGGMGTTIHQRGIGQLLAEALHDHPRGAEHLLWRSKKFSVGGTAVDP